MVRMILTEHRLNVARVARAFVERKIAVIYVQDICLSMDLPIDVKLTLIYICILL